MIDDAPEGIHFLLPRDKLAIDKKLQLQVSTNTILGNGIHKPSRCEIIKA
jgi:hypothetical protein